MESEVKEKLEVKKREGNDPVTMYLENIPGRVHKRMLRYRAEITGRMHRKVSIKEAYVEFLKEATRSIK